ncbi:transcriptional regulator [Leptolyngbya sp. PCC 7375]|nr:transcriptional regulator [Leptolyngbya sp. PCC 7375]
MDLYQIRYFLTIADVQSFTKASELLYVSQPSLSAGIKKLEQELDVTLFERGGRRTLLTPAGQRFQESAKAILAAYQAARQDLQQLKEQPTLRIGTLHTLRSHHIAKLIGAFRQQYPNVTVVVLNGYLQDIKDWLEQGKIDVAITWLQEQDSDENSQLLFHQPLTLAVSDDHALAKAKSACLRDLDGQPYIERINCEFWRAYDTLFADAGIQPNIVYSSNNEEWVISLIQVGMGMSIMPVWADLTAITYVSMTDLSLSRTIGLRWRKLQMVEPVAWFCNFVMEYDLDIDVSLDHLTIDRTT